MHLNGRLDHDCGKAKVKWQPKQVGCLTLPDMKIWLVGLMVVCVFMVVLLKCELLEEPLIPSYVYMGERQQPSLFSVTNSSSAGVIRFRVNAETNAVANEPLKKVELAKEPPVIRLALFHVKQSSQESAILSVWKYLTPVLSRSDCFLEAKQGLEESENHWRQFIEERTLENTSVNISSEKQCPYSISSANLTLTDSYVEIPCGLVVDSSVTIVAYPWGAEMNFAIELLGKLPGELDPCIVLRVNARLQGDQITDDPVIVQSTWTKEHDWGDEERCPNSATPSKKVDGLDVCTERVGKAIVKRKGSTMKGPMVGDRNPWFPFMNGVPFAATLWVGWEGFHMTVNGKHITSFEYRQNLKPSVVNAVRLNGSVEPISILSTGLPTSEDIPHVDLEFLKAPSLIRKQRNELFIGVFSTGNNFDRRMAVRRSWMQFEAVRSGNVTVRFFVGQEWPDASYPPWAHGPGYIISKDIANFIVQSHFSSSLKLFKLEDVAMGIWIEAYKKQNHTVHYVHDGTFDHSGCRNGYTVAHYQNPKHMSCLWGKLREDLGPVCC